MDLNKKSLKEFNKILSKKKKDINLEKLFENDNYLVQTLKRTKRVLLENPAEHLETNLDNALQTINKNITLLNDPEIKEYNSENNLFKKNYTDFLKTSENSNTISFNDIITHYLNSGYKLPNLDFEHNLFKINPLIEENLNKMTNHFITQNKEKLTQDKIISLKSMMYLNKLNRLIFCKYNKKRESMFKALNNTQMRQKRIEEKEEIKKLKEDNENIKRLIYKLSIEDKKKKNQYSHLYRNSQQFFSSFKKLNSFKEHPLLQKTSSNKDNKDLKDSKLQTETTKNITTNSESNNIPPNDNNDNINSDICKTENIKTNNKQIRDYIESKIPKHKIIDRNERVSFSSGVNMKYHLNNKTLIPLGIKTDINFYGKKKFSYKNKLYGKNKDKEDLGLFARTQVKEKRFNKYNPLYRKRNCESRNNSNNIYSNPFSNKTEFFDFTYRRLKRGNFEDINVLVKRYLNEIEGRTKKEIELILSKYDYKNFKVNLKELEINIHKNEIDRKTEKIYLNNFISKRIMRQLENMRKKEEQISRLNKIITAVGNHSE